MRIARNRKRQRRGFTLVEMMVVILIIAVLVGLISAAVARARTKANQVRARTDIGQLAVALESFKSRYGFYPPSRIKLCENFNWYNLGNPKAPNYQLDVDSVQILQRMFPRIDMFAWANPSPMGWIDWNGNLLFDAGPSVAGAPAPGAQILEGDQCLVFFLGGIPDNAPGQQPHCLGFASQSSNPTAPSGERQRPFFEFEEGRLVVQRRGPAGATPINASAPSYYSYLDTYSRVDTTGVYLLGQGNVYAYFSSYKSRNGYNRYVPAFFAGLLSTDQRSSDCWNLEVWPIALPTPTNNTSPYDPAVLFSNAPKYYNPDTFQILSAGADHFFSRGTEILAISAQGVWGGRATWSPALAGVVVPFVDDISAATGLNWPGFDDQANFHDTLMGIGTN